jgi:DNA polymerase-3 subunit alpha
MSTRKIIDFNCSAHRLFNNPNLDHLLESIRRIVAEGNHSRLHEIIEESQTNPALHLILKIILDNGHTLAFLGETESKRLTDELTIILNHDIKGLINYFLIFEDISYFFKTRQEFCNVGRGLSPSVYLNYLLGITKVNPLEYKLIFERSLNSNDLPEIQFEIADSTNLYEHLIQKYGQKNFSQIGVKVKYKINSAFRESQEELKIKWDMKEVYFIESIIRDAREKAKSSKIYAKKLETEKGFFEFLLEDNSTITAFFKRNFILKELMLNKIDKDRGPSFNHKHVTGIVLDEKLQTLDRNCFIPHELEPLISAETVEEYQLLKLNFLRHVDYKHLNSSNIELKKMKDVDFNNVDVFKFLTDIQNKGSFADSYLSYCSILRDQAIEIRSIEDMAFVIALARPSMFEHSLLGKIDGSSPVSIVNDIVASTHGYLIYQEQILDILNVIGVSFESATVYLKNLMKKKNDENSLLRNRLIQTFGKDGDYLFQLLSDLAPYTFSRSHAISSAILKYLTAYYDVVGK